MIFVTGNLFNLCVATLSVFWISVNICTASTSRTKRAVHEIYLSDPLDCLSQLVCGLNTFPPQTPSARTTPANDYAYLLKHVVIRLKKQKPPPTTTTTTTTPKPDLIEQDDEDDDYEDDDIDSEEDEEEDTTVAKKDDKNKTKNKFLKNSKDQHGDLVEMKGLYPPYGLVDYRRESRSMPKIINKKSRVKSNKKKNSARDDNKKQKKVTPKPSLKTRPPPMTQLEQLQQEQDIRAKLRSGAQCLYGILEHTCPFKYSELLVLMSSVLERQKVVSYSSNRIVPMVGYLLKSKSLTQTLKSTFFALERVNNITLAKSKNQEPFTFGHVYDEIVRGEFGNGLHIVETKNDATANLSVGEDDEFDAALANPFLPKEKIPGYAIKDRSKNKKNNHQSEDSGEENSAEDEESILPPLEEDAGPFAIGDIAGFPNGHEPDYYEDEDTNNSDKVGESKEDVPLPPVYGLDGNGKRSKVPLKARILSKIWRV